MKIHPQRRPALLILVQGKGEACDSRARLAVGVFHGSAETNQARDSRAGCGLSTSGERGRRLLRRRVSHEQQADCTTADDHGLPLDLPP